MVRLSLSATHFLLYLSHDSFVGEAGEALAAEADLLEMRTAIELLQERTKVRALGLTRAPTRTRTLNLNLNLTLTRT